ncbi:uncharacterized protein PRCAT00005091001 [Priceomyces carsonii]|uniref:uncharacterized protein n=1 Tax=Priceomyces carsonii TaxID=28549 RepID=UPI002ED82334|nr:unnamed protein product [Priceomyces carsonii]
MHQISYVLSKKDFSNTSMTELLSNKDLLKTQGYINGTWISAPDGLTFEVINPGNGQVLAKVAELGPNEVKEAAIAASKSFESFKLFSPRSRSDLLKKWNEKILQNLDDLAKLISLENGKAFSDSLGEVKYAASYLEWYAEEAPRIYGDTISTLNPSNRTYTIRQPIGVCAFITPWNFPAAMITRKIGAAIAAGCSVIIKPGAETPLTALALAHLAELAGVPSGVVNVVTTQWNTRKVGLELCKNKLIKKLSFTGSTATGKTLMEQCSSSLKKLSLELGGNAPFIVFGDADLDCAIEGLIASKFRVSGQTCVCANRIFVHQSVYDDFVEKLVAYVKKFNVGYGLDSNVTHGPLIHQAALEKVDMHVSDAASKGAKILIGGQALSQFGSNYYSPTVLTEVTTEMLCTKEETFGPVAPIIRFNDDAEVINKANDTDVGLAGYFYTRDVSRAYRVAEALEVGMVGVNVGVISDSALPFGGVKESGFGREGSKYGIDEYLVVKAVTVGI